MPASEVLSANTPVPASASAKPLNGGDEQWIGPFLAGLSGWTLDAFDFFLVVLSLTAIGRDFHESVPKMLAASWATLALRPVGAFLFGFISDRYGRRRPLMVNLCLFSVVELATAFTHSYTQFIVVRALFGIVMGKSGYIPGEIILVLLDAGSGATVSVCSIK